MLRKYNAKSWRYTDWGITDAEYRDDPALRAAFERCRRIMGNAKRTLPEKIHAELCARARAGCHTDDGALRVAEIRDRQLFERDYAAYKNGTYQP